jgi:apolipoprotein N-acyltransferase
MAKSDKAQSDPPYERLGAKVLSLPDVIAQSVGFMGPVFSSAFVIPLVVGVISASGKGGGVASPLSVIIAGIGVFALGWIVSSYAKEVPCGRIAVRLRDAGSATGSARPPGGCTTAASRSCSSACCC